MARILKSNKDYEYFKLYSNDDPNCPIENVLKNNSKKVKIMEKMFNFKTISSSIVVSQEYKYEKNEDCEVDDKVHYKYRLLNNPEELYEFLYDDTNHKKYNHNFNIHEVITKFHKIQKLRFDVDTDITKITPELLEYIKLKCPIVDINNMNDVARFLAIDLYELIYKNLPNILIDLYNTYDNSSTGNNKIINPKIYVFQSHNLITKVLKLFKISLHFVLDYYTLDNETNKYICNLFINTLPDVYKPLFDSAVYKQTQSFRMLDCTKYDINRPKRFVKTPFNKIIDQNFINEYMSHEIDKSSYTQPTLQVKTPESYEKIKDLMSDKNPIKNIQKKLKTIENKIKKISQSPNSSSTNINNILSNISLTDNTITEKYTINEKLMNLEKEKNNLSLELTMLMTKKLNILKCSLLSYIDIPDNTRVETLPNVFHIGYNTLTHNNPKYTTNSCNGIYNIELTLNEINKILNYCPGTQLKDKTLMRISSGECPICHVHHEKHVPIINHSEFNLTLTCFRSTTYVRNGDPKCIVISQYKTRYENAPKLHIPKEILDIITDAENTNKTPIAPIYPIVNRISDNILHKTINTKYIDKSIYEHEENLIFIKSGTGSGKSKALLDFIEPKLTDKTTTIPTITPTMCILTYRAALANELHTKYQHLDFALYSTLGKNIEKQPRLIIQVESIWKLNEFFQDKDNLQYYDIIIIDEIVKLIEQLHSPLITNHKSFQSTICELFSCKKLICMDAFLTDNCINSLLQIRYDIRNVKFDYLDKTTYSYFTDDEYKTKYNIENDKLLIVNNIFKHKTERKYYEYPDINQLTAALINEVEDNKKVGIATNSRSFAKKLHGLLVMLYTPKNDKWEFINGVNTKTITKGKCSKNIKLYTGDSNEKIKSELKDINNNWDKADIVIYTNVIESGNSFDKLHFDSIFMYFTPMSTNYSGCMQMTDRIRNIKSNICHVFIKKIKYRPLTFDNISQEITQIEYAAKYNITNSDIIYQQRGQKIDIMVKNYPYYNFINNRVINEDSKAFFRERFHEAWLETGATIHQIDLVNGEDSWLEEDTVKIFNNRLSIIQRVLKDKKCDSISNADLSILTESNNHLFADDFEKPIASSSNNNNLDEEIPLLPTPKLQLNVAEVEQYYENIAIEYVPTPITDVDAATMKSLILQTYKVEEKDITPEFVKKHGKQKLIKGYNNRMHLYKFIKPEEYIDSEADNTTNNINSNINTEIFGKDIKINRNLFKNIEDYKSDIISRYNTLKNDHVSASTRFKEVRLLNYLIAVDVLLYLSEGDFDIFMGKTAISGKEILPRFQKLMGYFSLNRFDCPLFKGKIKQLVSIENKLCNKLNIFNSTIGEVFDIKLTKISCHSENYKFNMSF